MTAVTEGENMCTGAQLEGLDTAFSFASLQLSGICTAKVDPPRVCSVDKVLAECIPQSKSWSNDRISECR